MNLTQIFLIIIFAYSVCYAEGPVVFSKQLSAASSTKVLISFQGDIIIHDELYKKVLADPKHDFTQIWKTVIPWIEKADYSYANLEGPTALGLDSKLKQHKDPGFIYDKNIYSGTDFLFNYHPSLLDALKNSGFDILSNSNNHSFDRGALGLDKTIDEFDHRKIQYVGVRKKNTIDPLFTLSEVKGFKLAWIACTEILNGFSDKFNQLLRCDLEKEKILNLIHELSLNKTIDAIFILPHWGVEYSHKQTPLQKSLAHAYLEAGALAVVGSHPHVLQPVEKYITQDKRETFIAYSLGNFVAYQRDIGRKSSAIVFLELSKSVSTSTQISDYYYEPTTRSKTLIFPAGDKKDVLKHVEKFLGPYLKK